MVEWKYIYKLRLNQITNKPSKIYIVPLNRNFFSCLRNSFGHNFNCLEYLYHTNKNYVILNKNFIMANQPNIIRNEEGKF